ncbi:MAG: hypothetical protein JXA13_03905 [Anaerolineales bacterium]|nr:hypothetical protein [Anaerolineales bacterium]
MKHRPFEDWLLDDQPLDPSRKHELDAHLRECGACFALAEVNLALRSARTAAPAAGFTARFQERLILQKRVQRRRQVIGMTLFALGGLALFAWLIAPYVYGLEYSPASWVTDMVGYFLFVLTAFQAVGQAGSVIFGIASEFIPPFVWMVMISALAGFSLLWVVSIWKFAARLPQGVQG